MAGKGCFHTNSSIFSLNRENTIYACYNGLRYSEEWVVPDRGLKLPRGSSSVASLTNEVCVLSLGGEKPLLGLLYIFGLVCPL